MKGRAQSCSTTVPSAGRRNACWSGRNFFDTISSFWKKPEKTKWKISRIQISRGSEFPSKPYRIMHIQQDQELPGLQSNHWTPAISCARYERRLQGLVGGSLYCILQCVDPDCISLRSQMNTITVVELICKVTGCINKQGPCIYKEDTIDGVVKSRYLEICL